MTASRVDCLQRIIAFRLSRGETLTLPAPGGVTITIDRFTTLPDPVPGDLAPEVAAMLGHIETARGHTFRPPTEFEVRQLAHGTCPRCTSTCGAYVDGQWAKCRRCHGQGTVILL